MLRIAVVPWTTQVEWQRHNQTANATTTVDHAEKSIVKQQRRSSSLFECYSRRIDSGWISKAKHTSRRRDRRVRPARLCHCTDFFFTVSTRFSSQHSSPRDIETSVHEFVNPEPDAIQTDAVLSFEPTYHGESNVFAIQLFCIDEKYESRWARLVISIRKFDRPINCLAMSQSFSKITGFPAEGIRTSARPRLLFDNSAAYRTGISLIAKLLRK